MKSESEYCTIIKNSLIDGFKIPDPTGSFSATIKRAFDGIGMVKENSIQESENNSKIFICWEAKLLKKLQAFSLNRVEPHQNYYLSAYSKAQGVRSFLFVGIDCSRSDKRSYIFDWKLIEKYDLYNIGFSFHKEFLDKLPYSEIKKGTFDISPEYIINEKAVNDVYGNFQEVVDNFKAKKEEK